MFGVLSSTDNQKHRIQHCGGEVQGLVFSLSKAKSERTLEALPVSDALLTFDALLISEALLILGTGVASTN